MKIVITGPRSVGKTTISKLVAEKLSLPYVSSDQLSEDALKNKGGLDRVIKSGELKDFIAEKGYTLILSVFDGDKFVFDLSGGSVTSRTFQEASEKVRQKAKESAFVLGLLPFEDSEKSINLLFSREKEREHFKDMNKEELFQKVKDSFLKFPEKFESFCDKIIYTRERNPEEIAEEIIRIIKNPEDKFTIEWKGEIHDCVWCDDINFEKLDNVKQSSAFVFDENGKICVVKLRGKDYWSLPGGGPEPEDKSHEETLIREAFEEADLKLKDIQPLGHIIDIPRNNPEAKSYQLRYIAFVEEIKDPSIDPATGGIPERMFIDPKDFIEITGWGKEGEIQIKKALERFK